MTAILWQSNRTARHRVPATLLTLALMVAGCGGDETGGEASADRNSGDMPTVQVVEFPGLLQMFYAHVADEEGFFEEQGFSTEFVTVQSGPALVTALLGGNADLGMVGPQLIWPAMQQGEDVLSLAGTVKLNYVLATCGPDVATPNIDAPFPENLQDLNGKTIGVIGQGTQTERFALRLLDAAGLRPGENVQIQYVGAPGTAIPACKSGKIDFYTFPPPSQALLGELDKDYRIVADALEESSGGLFEGFIADVYATTSSYQSENPEVVQGFCEALVQADTFARDEANVDRISELLAKYTEIPVERARELWEAGLADSLLVPLTPEAWAKQAEALEEELSTYVPEHGKYVADQCTQIVSAGA